MIRKTKILLLAILSIFLTACGQEPEYERAPVTYYQFRNKICYYDEKSMEMYPLCFDTACDHKEITCDAYLGDSVNKDDAITNLSGVAYQYKDKIYSIEKMTNQNDVDLYYLVSMDVRGNNREYLAQLDSEDSDVWWWTAAGEQHFAFIGNYLYYMEHTKPYDGFDDVPEQDYAWVTKNKLYIRMCRVDLDDNNRVERLCEYMPFYSGGKDLMTGTSDYIYYLFNNLDSTKWREGYVANSARLWCYDVAAGEFKQVGELPAIGDGYVLGFRQFTMTDEGDVYIEAYDCDILVQKPTKQYIMKYSVDTGELEPIYSCDYNTIIKKDGSVYEYQGDGGAGGVVRYINYGLDYICMYESQRGFGHFKFLDYNGNVVDTLEVYKEKEYPNCEPVFWLETEEYIICNFDMYCQSLGFNLNPQLVAQWYMPLENVDKTLIRSVEFISAIIDKNDIGTGNIKIKQLANY